MKNVYLLGEVKNLYIYFIKDDNNIFKLYLFILEIRKNRVVEGFLKCLCVPGRCILYTFRGKEVYISGATCVVIRLKMCTLKVIGTT